MADAEIIKAFVVESLDLLDEVEPRLVELEQAASEAGHMDAEAVNSVFRLFHSMKGSAGCLQLTSISHLTHDAETLLDLYRKGKAVMRSEHTSVLFRSMDLIRSMLEHVDAEMNDRGFDEPVGQLADELKTIIEQETGRARQAPAKSKPEPTPLETPATGGPSDDVTPEIRQRFVDEAEDQIDAFEQALMQLDKDPAPDTLHEAFRLMHTLKGNCGFMGLVDLEAVGHRLETVLQCLLDGQLPVNDTHTGILLNMVDVLRGSVVSFAEGGRGGIEGCDVYKEFLDDLVPGGAPTDEPDEPTTDQSVPKPAAAEEAPGPLAEPPAVVDKPVRSMRRQDIRVDLEKLDSLINLVGELVISEAMVTRHPRVAEMEEEGVERAVYQLRRVSRDLQDTAMSLRMVPLSATFRKMIRVVHDLTAKSGKKVELKLLGEETEVDKTVIEQIADPLVHIVRNALDHGIETPDQRTEAGKPDTGTLTIEGRHEGGEVWVIIRDDGRGLSREKILAKAIDRDLVSGDGSELSDGQVYKLIFEAGFSTAETVTDVSGRGVGMDVVRRNLEKLKGRVDIRAREGVGSTFILRIPLTLAIIEGMLVRVGKARYTIPMLTIRESIRIEDHAVVTTADGQEVVRVRDEMIPVLRLHSLLGVEPDSDELAEGILVIVEADGQTVCLFVDEILGQQETVIKGISRYLGRARGVSGCTILGDGQVSLILDMAALMQAHRQAPSSVA